MISGEDYGKIFAIPRSVIIGAVIAVVAVIFLAGMVVGSADWSEPVEVEVTE